MEANRQHEQELPPNQLTHDRASNLGHMTHMPAVSIAGWGHRVISIPSHVLAWCTVVYTHMTVATRWPPPEIGKEWTPQGSNKGHSGLAAPSASGRMHLQRQELAPVALLLPLCHREGVHKQPAPASALRQIAIAGRVARMKGGPETELHR